ncbi:MAG: hypothetical protein AAGI38_13985 [Bacteroidota bacterium]
MNPLRINLWASPRNVSTAFMYSFAQRPDTKVFDEPLYGHYLTQRPVPHPGADQVLQEQETEGEKVVKEVLLGPHEHPVVFFKNNTKKITVGYGDYK